MKKTLATTNKNPLAVIAPPPTKSEVIEALAQIRLLENNKKAAERDAEKKRLTSEVDEMLTAFLRKNINKFATSFNLGVRHQKYTNGDYVYTDELTSTRASINLDGLPKSIEVRLLKIDTLDKLRFNRNIDSIRREIRSGASGSKSERVAALLSNPASRSALEETLAQLARE